MVYWRLHALYLSLYKFYRGPVLVYGFELQNSANDSPELYMTSLQLITQYTLRLGCERFVASCTELPFVFSHVEYCDMHFVYGFCDGNARSAVEEYQRRFPDRRIPSRSVFSEFTRHCVILVLFRVFRCSLKGRWYERLIHERTFFRWFK